MSETAAEPGPAYLSMIWQPHLTDDFRVRLHQNEEYPAVAIVDLADYGATSIHIRTATQARALAAAFTRAAEMLDEAAAAALTDDRSKP